MRPLQKPSLASIFEIVCSRFALSSDGFQNNVMNMIDYRFCKAIPKVVHNQKDEDESSNSSLVWTIFGQVIMGVLLDRLNRKQPIVVVIIFGLAEL